MNARLHIAGLMLSASTALFAQSQPAPEAPKAGPHGKMRNCAQDADPAKCEAQRKEMRAKMRENMTSAREACKGKEGKGGGQEGGKFSCDFENVVVNLSGSLGTKYLKTSFTFTSSSADLKKIIEENKKRMLDVAITVLSSRSLADLEVPGSKNVVRNDLKARFNDALQSDLIEQIFFTEFVIQ